MQGIRLRGKARAILHTTAGVVLGYNNGIVYDQLGRTYQVYGDIKLMNQASSHCISCSHSSLVK